MINYFGEKKIKNLIVINPDNPTGNYIPKNEIMRLIDWSRNKNIQLVIDENFADFADENDTLIEQNILNENPHLCVVKSISKSFGVAGLQLGVLASGDEKLIDALKKSVSIWNINSFAEFYMQIAEKYKSDYLRSLQAVRNERARFAAELAKIPNLRVIPSQANFIMVEVGGITSRELTKNLLTKYNIFVKDLSSKAIDKNYLRFAVRSTEDNEKLLKALIRELLR